MVKRPHDLMLLVDKENTAAIALYKSMGFDAAEDGGNITARALL